MTKKSDEEILYDCYKKIESNIACKKKKTIAESKDKTMINGIQNSLMKLLMYLDEFQELTAVELQKRIISAKGIYIQYLQVKYRHPVLVSNGMQKNMDRLIRALCRHEAEMIALMRLQEPGGDRIDLQFIFNQKKYCKENNSANNTNYSIKSLQFCNVIDEVKKYVSNMFKRNFKVKVSYVDMD